MSFTGFDPTAVALLPELSAWDADRYSAHQAELSGGLTKPGLALALRSADMTYRSVIPTAWRMP